MSLAQVLFMSHPPPMREGEPQQGATEKERTICERLERIFEQISRSRPIAFVMERGGYGGLPFYSDEIREFCGLIEQQTGGSAGSAYRAFVEGTIDRELLELHYGAAAAAEDQRVAEKGLAWLSGSKDALARTVGERLLQVARRRHLIFVVEAPPFGSWLANLRSTLCFDQAKMALQAGRLFGATAFYFRSLKLLTESSQGRDEALVGAIAQIDVVADFVLLRGAAHRRYIGAALKHVGFEYKAYGDPHSEDALMDALAHDKSIEVESPEGFRLTAQALLRNSFGSILSDHELRALGSLDDLAFARLFERHDGVARLNPFLTDLRALLAQA